MKQVKPTAQINGLCCSLSDIHTATLRQMDGRQLRDKTLFHKCSMSRLTVFHINPLHVLEQEWRVGDGVGGYKETVLHAEMKAKDDILIP